MSEYEAAKANIVGLLNEGHGLTINNDVAHLIQAADKELATKDAELARLREALEDIDKLEIRRMYETCPDCYSESLGCSENKVCAQFKGRTLIQKVIDEALKSNDS